MTMAAFRLFAWSTSRNESDAFVRRAYNFCRVGFVMNIVFIVALVAGWIQPA